MYFAAVLSLMLVFPVSSVVVEKYLAHSDAGLLLLIGKWFAFWAVGIRLISAGARQTMNPRFTAETILGVKGPESWIVVRELGIANIAVGTIASLSLYVPQWRTPAAVAGAVFFGLAGINHFVQKNRNQLENIAMVSILFVCGVLCAYCLAGVPR